MRLLRNGEVDAVRQCNTMFSMMTYMFIVQYPMQFNRLPSNISNPVSASDKW